MTTQQSGITKNRVAAVPHEVFMLQLVDHRKVFENTDDSHKAGEPVSVNGTVDLSGVIADADSHSVAAEISIGLILKGKKYFVVVGERAYALDDLRVHGVLSGCDVAEMEYTLKYLRSALAS